MFTELFKILDDRILVVDDLIETFDGAFFVVRKFVGVGMSRRQPETPVFVAQCILAGECRFDKRYRDLCCGILEEELCLEGEITTTGLERPGGEVVVENLGQVLEVDFKRRLCGVHYLLFAFFFVTILFFNGGCTSSWCLLF
jgi:hypothetical protein